MSRDGLFAVAVLLMLLHVAGGGGHPFPDRATVAAAVTGGKDALAWGRSRMAALLAASPGLEAEAAISVLAHWALETANGAAEWNWNLGNIRPARSTDPAYVIPGHGASPEKAGGGYWRSYGSLAEGIAGYLSLVRDGRYASCWAKLQTDPTSDAWVRCLGSLGYFTDDADHYAAGYLARRALIRSTMGVPA